MIKTRKIERIKSIVIKNKLIEHQNFRCLCACWHVLLLLQQLLENSAEAAVVEAAVGLQEEDPQKVLETVNKKSSKVLVNL